MTRSRECWAWGESAFNGRAEVERAKDGEHWEKAKIRASVSEEESS